MICEVTMFLI